MKYQLFILKSTPVIYNFAKVVNDNRNDNNKFQVVLYFFLMALPVVIVLVLLNTYINKDKKIKIKKEEAKVLTKRLEESLIKEEKTKENTPPVSKLLKLDFKQNEKIENKLDVEIFSEEKKEYVPYKIVITQFKFAILNKKEELHIETPLEMIKKITNKEKNVYDYIFKNGQTITIKSDELQKILQKKVK